MPTQPLDGNVYLRSLTICDADVQYATEAVIYHLAGTEDEQEIAVEVAGCAPGATVESAMYVNGSEYARLSATAASSAPYSARMVFSRNWYASLQPGDTLAVRFGQAGGQEYQFALPTAVEEAMLVYEDGYAENVPVSLGCGSANEDPEERTVALPDWVWGEGCKIFMGIPLFPINVFCDPDGHFGIAAQLFSVDFLRYKDGKNYFAEQEDGTKNKRLTHMFSASPKKAWDEYWENTKKSWNQLTDALYYGGSGASSGDASSEAAEGTSPSKRMFGSSPLTSNFNVSIAASLIGYGQAQRGVETDDLYWNCDLCLSGDLSGSLVCTKSFIVLYVPCYVTFDVSMLVRLKAMWGLSFDQYLNHIDWTSHDLTQGKLDVPFKVSVQLRPELGATCGVGLCGIVSISIRIYAYLFMEIAFDYVEGKPSPHIKCRVGGHLQFSAQALFFKFSYSPGLLPDFTIYDNWQQSEGDQNQETPQLSDVLAAGVTKLSAENQSMVTDTELATSAEFMIAGRRREDLLFDVSKERIANIRQEMPSSRTIASVLNPHYAQIGEEAYNPINGLKPLFEQLLWKGAYSNPRMRIVHTDATKTTSDAPDRCFMVRLAVVKVAVPSAYQTVRDEHVPGQFVERVVKPATEASALEATESGEPAILLDASLEESSEFVTRTRLVVSEWDHELMVWGEAEPVDFICLGEVDEYDRLNAYDLDFDVEVDDGTLLLAITSAVRPEGERASSYEECEKTQYISLVRWDPDANPHAVAAGSTRTIHESTGKSLFHPRILKQSFDHAGALGMHCIVYSYACSYWSDNNERERCTFVATIFDDMTRDSARGLNNRRLTPPLEILSSGYRPDPDILATGSFEVACPDRLMTVAGGAGGREQSVVVISWSHPPMDGMDALSMVLLRTFSVDAATDANGNIAYTPSSIAQGDPVVFGNVAAMVKLSSSDQQGLFSCADTNVPGDTKPLKMVCFNKDALSLYVCDNTGDTDKVQYFSSYDGRRLYCVRSMDGEAPAQSDFMDGTAAGAMPSGSYNSPEAQSGEGGSVSLYQLLEARWVDELQTYYDFYPIAQLDNVPDNIGVIATNNVRSDFTFATITDIENSRADIYQVAVPKIMAATCGEAAPCSPFAMPGDTCWYTVDITNVGNAPITLIRMKAYDNAGNEIGEEVYDDLSQHVQDSVDSVQNVCNEDGSLALDEKGNGKYEIREDSRDTAGILWPGKTRTYKFKFVIPESLSETGNVDFSVSLSGCEDHMDDPQVERFAQFREPVLESATRLIRPMRFVSGAAEGDAVTSWPPANRIVGEDKREVLSGEGVLANRDKLRMAVEITEEARVSTSSTAIQAASYQRVGGSGDTGGSDDNGGSGGSGGSGSGGSGGGSGSGGSGSSGGSGGGSGSGSGSSSEGSAAGAGMGASGYGANEENRAGADSRAKKDERSGASSPSGNGSGGVQSKTADGSTAEEGNFGILGLGALGLAAGALAAGVVAYERRRAENEEQHWDEQLR